MGRKKWKLGEEMGGKTSPNGIRRKTPNMTARKQVRTPKKTTLIGKRKRGLQTLKNGGDCLCPNLRGNPGVKTAL